jgi:cell filamentation protein
VYDWAGELRVTDLVRPSEDPDGPANEFVKPEDIERLAPVIFSQLGDPAELWDRPTSEVVDVPARTYAGVDVLHPFVECNGRTQPHLPRSCRGDDWAPRRLDPDRRPPERDDAEAFGIGSEPVREALADCIERRPDDEAELDAQDSLRPTGGGVTRPGSPVTRTTSLSTRRLSITCGREHDEPH